MPDTNSNALLSPPQRPRVQRQRSSSLPFIQAIEVTATEAAIMFAAEQAATSRRRACSPDRHQQRRRRRRPQSADPARAADPARNDPSQDETGDKDNGPSEDLQQQQPSAQPRSNPSPPPASHRPDVDLAAPKPRQPSVTGLMSEELHALLPLPQNPLNTYSANLARFIQSRINSIRSAIPAPPLSPSSPCSCPELSQFYPFSDLPSPTDPGPSGPSGLLDHNPFEAIDPLIPANPTDSTDPPNLANPSASRVERNLSIALPPLPFPFRPPLRSTFSNWSSTSGCNSPAAWADEPPPSPLVLNGDSIASTPSILELYASATSRSGFAGTPLDDPVAEEGAGAAGAGAGSGSGSAPAPTSAPPSAPAPSSAPAPASVSASPSPAAAATPDQSAEPSFLRPSYFSPRHCPQQVLAAISPYEGGALTRVVDVFIQAPNRVVVEGMAFEMVG